MTLYRAAAARCPERSSREMLVPPPRRRRRTTRVHDAATTLLVATTLATRAFPFAPRVSDAVGRFRCRPVVRSPTTVLRSFSDDDDDEDDDVEWSLEADWALADGAPRFTVGVDDGVRRTFWTQLRASTPELTGVDESSLRERYETLSRRRRTFENDEDEPLPPVGPSPDVLEDWEVDERSSRITGTLSDGRSVWFVAQTVGRLEGDVVVDDDFGASSSSNELGGRPGGYAEAVGNRVYELGTARRRRRDDARVVEARNNGGLFSRLPTFNESSSSSSTPPPLWRSTTTAALSALLATALLSASVGFGAGLGLSYERSTEAVGGDQAVVRVADPSAREARARAEARVLWREREIRLLDDRLAQDRARLGALEREESAAMISGTTDSNANEPTVAERRASVEARVLRTERILDAVSRRLANDRAEMSRYRTEERAASLLP